MKVFRLRILVCGMILCVACHAKTEKVTDTGEPQTQGDTLNNNQKAVAAGAFSYDLGHPDKRWAVPPELLEISGITPVDATHLLAIEDFTPTLYLLSLASDNVVIEKKILFKDTVPGKKFDVEDVTMANNIVYALWSHGTVYKISDWRANMKVKEIPTGLSKDNNTEGICFDPVTNKLLIACKNDAGMDDVKKSTRAIYEFNTTAEKLDSTPFMVITGKEFKDESGNKIKFYPSAIAVHPVTHDVYILSTRDTKCMAVFTHSGELKYVSMISAELMPQPEGICFSADGTLYISTEGKTGGKGYILRFGVKK